jgi:hypothetical protein
MFWRVLHFCRCEVRNSYAPARLDSSKSQWLTALSLNGTVYENEPKIVFAHGSGFHSGRGVDAPR